MVTDWFIHFVVIKVMITVASLWWRSSCVTVMRKDILGTQLVIRLLHSEMFASHMSWRQDIFSEHFFEPLYCMSVSFSLWKWCCACHCVVCTCMCAHTHFYDLLNPMGIDNRLVDLDRYMYIVLSIHRNLQVGPIDTNTHTHTHIIYPSCYS